jgi:hypothetical protein
MRWEIAAGDPLDKRSAICFVSLAEYLSKLKLAERLSDERTV